MAFDFWELARRAGTYGGELPPRPPGTTVTRRGGDGRKPGVDVPRLAATNRCTARWTVRLRIALPAGFNGKGTAWLSAGVAGNDAAGHTTRAEGESDRDTLVFEWSGVENLPEAKVSCAPLALDLAKIDLELEERVLVGQVPRKLNISQSDLKLVRVDPPLKFDGGRVRTLPDAEWDVCCHRKNELEIYMAAPSIPEACLGRYLVRLLIRWKGNPPSELGFQAAPTGLDPSDPRQALPVRGGALPSGVGGEGTLQYDIGPSPWLREGTYLVVVQAVGPGGPLGNFWKSGLRMARGSTAQVATTRDGMLEVPVGVKCGLTTPVVVEFEAGESSGKAGSGGAPPDTKKKPTPEPETAGEGAAGGPVEPEGLTPLPAEGFATPAWMESAAEEAATEPAPFEGTLARFLASEESLASVPREGAGPGALGPPWTQLDLIVDPDDSQDSRSAIEGGEITGGNAVRGTFDGHRRGFLQGPM